jgi:sulfite reductase (ferredoxin)
MLLGENVKNNSQIAVINDFDKFFVEQGAFSFSEGSFKDHVLQMRNHEPSRDFAQEFYGKAAGFLDQIKSVRKSKVEKVA